MHRVWSSWGSGHAKATPSPAGAWCGMLAPPSIPFCQNVAAQRVWLTMRMGGGAGGASSNITSMRASTSSTLTRIRSSDAHQPGSCRGIPCSQKTTNVPGASMGKADDQPSLGPGRKPDSPCPGAARTRSSGSSLGDGQCHGARSLAASGVSSRCSMARCATATVRSLFRARPREKDSLRPRTSRVASPSAASEEAPPGAWAAAAVAAAAGPPPVFGSCCSHSSTSPTRLESQNRCTNLTTLIRPWSAFKSGVMWSAKSYLPARSERAAAEPSSSCPSPTSREKGADQPPSASSLRDIASPSIACRITRSGLTRTASEWREPCATDSSSDCSSDMVCSSTARTPLSSSTTPPASSTSSPAAASATARASASASSPVSTAPCRPCAFLRPTRNSRVSPVPLMSQCVA
mmetsp:Transcript_28459/g.91894  ORF Transcript_28459/g.91894 Transcript_28459/m.91894 type:complete len:406 (-) Transcript_28459:116-1333(-)